MNQPHVSPYRVVQESISPQNYNQTYLLPPQQQVLTASRTNLVPIQATHVITGSRTNLLQHPITVTHNKSPSLHASSNIYGTNTNVQNVQLSYTHIEPTYQTVNTQVIEKTFEIEKPVYVERIQEQIVEEIIESERYVENRDLILQLQHNLSLYQQDLRQLQIQSQQVNYIKDETKVTDLRNRNRQLVQQIKYIREQPDPVQYVEREVPVYEDEVQEIEKERFIENTIIKEIPIVIEKVVEIENFDRIRELESQIQYWRQQKPKTVEQSRVEYKENVIYQDEVQIVEKPVYKEKLIIKEKVIEKPIENVKTNIIEIPIIQYHDIIQEVEVEQITEVPVEDIRTEFIEKEVPQYVEQIEYIERPQYQTNIVEVPRIIEVEVAQEMIKTYTTEKPVVQKVERIKEVTKQIIIEKFIERPYNVYKTRELEQPYEVVKDVVKRVPKERLVNEFVEIPKFEYVERIKEIQVAVVKNVEVPIPVEKIVEIEEEYEQKHIVYKQKQKEIATIEYVERPIVKYLDRLVEKPVIVEKLKYVEKEIPVYKEVKIPQAVEVVREIKVEVPVEKKEIQYVDKVETVYIDKVIDKPREVIQYVEIPQPKAVYKDVYRNIEIQRKEIQYVEVPRIEYRDKIVERPYETVIHVEKNIETVKEVRVPVEKIKEVVKENVQYVEVPKIEYIDVPIEQEQLKIIDKQVPIDRVVKQNKQVPAYELVFVNKPYCLEEPVVKPKIKYHEVKKYKLQKGNMIAKTDVLKENIKTIDITQIQYKNKVVNTDVLQERTRQVDVTVIERVDKKMNRQQVRKNNVYNQVAHTDKIVEIVKRLDIENAVLQTYNKNIEVPEIQIIENRQNVEIEKLIEVPQIVEKQVIYQDDSKIARLEEELRLIQEKKRKIQYVELQPIDFQQRVLCEQQTNEIMTEIEKTGMRNTYSKLVTPAGNTSTSYRQSNSYNVQSYATQQVQVGQISKFVEPTVVTQTRNVVQQPLSASQYRQQQIVTSGNGNKIVTTSQNYGNSIITTSNNQRVQNQYLVNQNQSPVTKITGNYYEISPVVKRSIRQEEVQYSQQQYENIRNSQN